MNERCNGRVTVFGTQSGRFRSMAEVGCANLTTLPQIRADHSTLSHSASESRISPFFGCGRSRLRWRLPKGIVQIEDGAAIFVPAAHGHTVTCDVFHR